MARRTSGNVPQRIELEPEEKRRAIRRFEALASKISDFDPASVEGRDDPRVIEIAAAARSALEKTYPPGTTQYYQLSALSSIEYSMPLYAGRPTPLSEVREGLTRAKAECTILLRQAIEDLNEDLEELGPSLPLRSPVHSRAAFVVHGRDEGPREAVARFLERIDVTPIILHEQPNRGRTVIEKFEQHGDVAFAVVLLTPDDVGGTTAHDLKPRARQNVILELGYFIGKLGRDRVCAIKKGDIEQPSDLFGVVYIDYNSGDWRRLLANEIQAAGVELDWNKVMRS